MFKVNRIDSTDTNVSKYVFDFGNAVAESVLYKYPTYNERTVVCCSTQSGCPIGCRFCGAGDNFVRSLTADEIVNQTEYMFWDRNINADDVNRMQIMFMSMGEPMLNWKNLKPALYRLNALYPKAALLISTMGPRVDYNELMLVSQEIPNIGLQFSVHEAFDYDRNKLIPFKNKLKLSEIVDVGVQWHVKTERQPFFNYCVHDKNNSTDHVNSLLWYFDPAIWQATISVICERDESVAAANQRQRELAVDFCDKLMSAGYSTRVFDPAGQDDIGGGCGQLWFVQNWMKQHPELAKPTIGSGLEKVHTPV